MELTAERGERERERERERESVRYRRTEGTEGTKEGTEGTKKLCRVSSTAAQVPSNDSGPTDNLTSAMASLEALAALPFVVRERGVESATFAGTCRAARLAFRRWWPTLARWMLLELLQGVIRRGKAASVKPEEKKEKKRKTKSRSPKKETAEKPKGTVKVHRVSGATPDGRIVVKDSNLHDEVDITADHMTVGDVIDQLLTALDLQEDAPNWSCKVLEEGGMASAVARDFPASQLAGDLVMVAKGG